jgi:hypothetical protein
MLRSRPIEEKAAIYSTAGEGLAGVGGRQIAHLHLQAISACRSGGSARLMESSRHIRKILLVP